MRRVRPALAVSPRTARLFGRERVLAEIREALAGGAPVTLVGGPGVGKTEIALHLAATGGSRESSELVLVDLSSAREPGDVNALVAHTLDVRVGREPVANLRAALAARGSLLVLDRCDFALSEASTLVAALAGVCPIVSTAPCPLELPDERVIPIEPLGAEGSALFLARAERRGGAFEPNARDRDAVRRIVDLCGGLPFAIELAAAVERAPLRVCDELELVIDRDGVLRDVVEWATGALDPNARQALAQASVFEGPFSIDAFEAVVSFESDAPRAIDSEGESAGVLPARRPIDSEGESAGVLPARRPIDVLSMAVARGLVTRAPGSRDAAKLTIAPAVRVVALELLSDAERLAVLRRHASWFARAGEHDRADRLAAFEVALLDETPLVLTRLARALVPRLLREGARERAAALVEATSAVVTEGLSVARALVAEARGEATPPCEDGLVAAEIALRRDDPRAALALLAIIPDTATAEAIRTLRVTGDAHRRLGAPHEALDTYQASIELARRLDRPTDAAELLVRLAGVELDLGAPERAQPHLTEAIDVLSRARAERPWAIALATLADLLLEEGDEVGVDTLLLEARLHARRAGALDVLARIDVLAAARALGHGNVDNVSTLLAVESASEGTWGDLARGLDATLRARLDDRQGAADALPNGPVSAPLLGVLELAESRLARVRGENDALLSTRARARLSELGPVLTEVRIARRVLARMLDTPARVSVSRDGAWFSVDRVQVSFERRANLRRLLAALVRRRIEAPGRSLPLTELFSAGWPGERVTPRVLEDRLHTAVQTLRDLGLRTLLEHDVGWRLRGDVPIDVG